MLSQGAGVLVNVLPQIIIPVLLILLGLVVGRLSERMHFRRLGMREAALADMLVTDVRSFPGGVDAARGAEMVTAEVVIANDYLKSFLASLRKLVGGELRSYRTLLERARREVRVRMLQKARARGHNALCNVRIETADIGGMVRKGGAATVALSASAPAYTVSGTES